MERLTKRIDEEAVFHQCAGTCKTCGGAPCESIWKMVDRLAAYEDTELEPDEVEEYKTLCASYVRAGLDAKFVQACIDATENGMTVERLDELSHQKYVLIGAEGIGINVGIYPPKFFDTLESAHRKMCSMIAEIRRVSIEEIQCSGLVDKYFGWTEKDGKYYHFQIFEIHRNQRLHKT